MSPNHATKSRIYLIRKVEGLLCKKKIRRTIGSDRIGSERPPGRDAGLDWALGLYGPSFRAGPAKNELGRGPLAKGSRDRAVSGGHGTAGGGSRPWTSR
ncbi:hypothetical protein CRG98_046375 [Punica granatum]|uniref:Uncharacterized protein n=1 Tax=Punica granatum TaxID=22663 RepID=A0A2I0HNC1_PUNGR|nr:hypothetical protein CRG98_046375 [Punica granatum]